MTSFHKNIEQLIRNNSMELIDKNLSAPFSNQTLITHTTITLDETTNVSSSDGIFYLSTTPPPSPHDIAYKDPEFEWTTGWIFCVVFPMSILILEIILGNLLVIVAILTQRNLRNPSNMMILSLAAADLAVGVFILPFNIADMIQEWRFGVVLCRIWLTSDVTLCSTSILHISAIAVDRFRSINEGVAYAQSRTKRMALIVCGALWVIALWIASSPVLGWNDWEVVDPNADKMKCELTRKLGYIIHSASGAFFIPALIMVGLYFRIFILIRSKLRERAKISCISDKKKASQHEQVETDDDHSSGDLVEEACTDGTKESISQTRTKKSVDLSSCPNEEDSSNNGVYSKKKHSEQIETILRNKIRFSLTKERKAAKTLGVIIGAFIICWTPFTLVYLTSGIMLALTGGNGVPFWFFQSVTWLGYVNSGLNPIIYTIYNPEFRRAFSIIINKILCRN